MKKYTFIIICFAGLVLGFSQLLPQTPPMPAPPMPKKPLGAGEIPKGATKQLLSVAAVVVPPPPVKTVTLSWSDNINPAWTVYRVYHSAVFRGPMTVLTNTTAKSIVLPAPTTSEFFGVRPVQIDGSEGPWATR